MVVIAKQGGFHTVTMLLTSQGVVLKVPTSSHGLAVSLAPKNPTDTTSETSTVTTETAKKYSCTNTDLKNCKHSDSSEVDTV